MIQLIVAILLWTAAIGSGLIAGVFFAFSTFVMTSLGRIPQAAGVAAMQSINSVIVGSPFMPVFFGTTLAGLVLAGIGLARWGAPGSAAMIAGGAVYVVGMFVCTVVFNVPLNNALAAADPAGAETADLWARYLADWTFWNHVRTAASTVACALFVAAIVAG